MLVNNIIYNLFVKVDEASLLVFKFILFYYGTESQGWLGMSNSFTILHGTKSVGAAFDDTKILRWSHVYFLYLLDGCLWGQAFISRINRSSYWDQFLSSGRRVIFGYLDYEEKKRLNKHHNRKDNQQGWLKITFIQVLNPKSLLKCHNRTFLLLETSCKISLRFGDAK